MQYIGIAREHGLVVTELIDVRVEEPAVHCHDGGGRQIRRSFQSKKQANSGDSLASQILAVVRIEWRRPIKYHCRNVKSRVDTHRCIKNGKWLWRDT